MAIFVRFLKFTSRRNPRGIARFGLLTATATTCLACVLMFSSLAFAQSKPEAKATPNPGAVQKPTQAKPEFQLADSLDGLFGQLKKTSDRRRAKRVEERIWSLWRASDSKSVDLLTGWARSAMGKKKYGQALDLLDQVLVMRPNYAEAWNQRATLHFMRSQYGKSIADIERTLALEPRHFGALSGLAVILERMGQPKRALDVWYRTLAIYPAMKNAQSSVARLEEQLAGSKL